MFTLLQNFITKLTIVIKLFNSITINEDSITLNNPIDCDVFITSLNKDFILHTNRRIFINCSEDFRAKLREEQESIEDILEVIEYSESI
jgi:hypothetical protein